MRLVSTFDGRINNLLALCALDSGSEDFERIDMHFTQALSCLDDFAQDYTTPENAAGIEIFRARMLNNLGLFYMSQGLYQEAIEKYRISCAIKSQHHDDRGLAQTRSNLAKCFCEMRLLGPASEELEEVVFLMTKSPDRYICSDTICDVAQMLGSILSVDLTIDPDETPFDPDEPVWQKLRGRTRRQKDSEAVLEALFELNVILSGIVHKGQRRVLLGTSTG